MQTKEIKAFGTQAANKQLERLTINRRTVTPHDVEIEILYCGICHSDLHSVRNEWGNTAYPVIPGHEIVGKITRVGGLVTKFNIGDLAAVGCIADSCHCCDACREGEEQLCENGWTCVTNSLDKILGGITYGGFSENIVVDENYVLHVPEKLDLASVAPILCAGITVYSPLKRWNAANKRVGIIGIGGLGHMAIKIAKAMGATVAVFSTSAKKAEDAKRLGADEFILSGNVAQMSSTPKLDMILDTVSGNHNVNPYLHLLKINGLLVIVGLPVDPLAVDSSSLVNGRKSFSGSIIGGIRETQEVLDFCAEHNITPDIELINVADINIAFDRLQKGDVKYRFVVDMKSLRGYQN
ncbi:MAG: NAD(P)-dependent alcohol dehydrogenase [Bacteroidales bacterium]|jgi:uncharacterized zinc-type alcohol dehydrogenase-like protein|nr:NAD(P)-dependent alcohol dehydrogenase [Bacteroidales bacterium]